MKTTIRNDALYLSLDISNVYLISKIDAKAAEISKIEDCEFCTWASYFIMNYKKKNCYKYVF